MDRAIRRAHAGSGVGPPLVLSLVLALILAGGGLLLSPTHATDTAPSLRSGMKLANHGTSQLNVSFGTPRDWSTHYRVITASNRMFTKGRKEYSVPVTWSGVRVPHAARTGDGNYTYVALGQLHRDGAPTAGSLPKVGAKGLLEHATAAPKNSTGFSGDLGWLMPPVTQPPASGPRVSVGTFNIRDAWLADSGARKWKQRRGKVVKQVRSSGVGVLMLQESGGPGTGKKRGIRQWQYLDKKLGRSWKSVTDTEFFVRTPTHLTGKKQKAAKRKKLGQRYRQQGVRILYRADRYRLRDAGWAPMPNVNRKQSFPTPWALLRDRASGSEFYVMSFHLAAGGSKSYAALRIKQANWLANRATKLRAGSRPIVIGGDLNSTRKGETAVDGSDVLFSRGFRDAASAVVRTNLNYPSTGGFEPSKVTDTWPRRIDTIMVRGGVGGAYSYTNHIRRPAQGIASDHFMQSAVLPLPAR